MRKITLAIIALVTSFNVNAATPASNDLSAAITKSIQKQSTNNQPTAMVYGGKDISRSVVATAREATWTKQPVAIG